MTKRWRAIVNLVLFAVLMYSAITVVELLPLDRFDKIMVLASLGFLIGKVT